MPRVPSLKRTPLGVRYQQDLEGQAIPVLAYPFPSPQVIKVTCQKPDSGKLGVHFRWEGKKGDRVKVLKIAEDSPLCHSALLVGHTVLAINGVACLSSTHTASLIGNSGSLITITVCSESCDRPYCSLVAAPVSKQHPGISFTSCRDRCLVRVARVFPKGFFAGSRLKQGDVVLSVNGAPVAKPEDADRALLCSTEPYILLYVLDMTAYRESILNEMRTITCFQDFYWITDPEVDEKDCNSVVLYSGDVAHAKLEFDFKSQHLVDRLSHLRVTREDRLNFDPSECSKRYNRAYCRVVLPFLKLFNEGMERRMKVLEEAVCCEAWEYKTKAMGDCTDAPPLREEEPVSADESCTQDESTDVPMVTAELQLLPLSAIQSVDERFDNS